MAKAKKVAKYELTTKLPREGHEWELMEKYKLTELLAMDTQTRLLNGETWDRFVNIRKQLIAGEVTNESNWRLDFGEWNYRHLCSSAYYSSEEFASVETRFREEYNSREDLQELYKTCVKDRYWLHTKDGKTLRQGEPEYIAAQECPDSYRMFMEVYNDTSARRMREVSRETPYLEGDLVLLRAPYVGHRDHDPYWVSPYSPEGIAGATTPDRSTPRIATVIGVTDEVSRSWRPTKGSKIIKVIWMGKEDISNVEEKYIKWHMRPTYKNGLKVRPQE